MALPQFNPDARLIEELLKPIVSNLPVDVYKALLRSKLSLVQEMLPDLKARFNRPPLSVPLPSAEERAKLSPHLPVGDPALEFVNRSMGLRVEGERGPGRTTDGRLALHSMTPSEMRARTVRTSTAPFPPTAHKLGVPKLGVHR